MFKVGDYVKILFITPYHFTVETFKIKADNYHDDGTFTLDSERECIIYYEYLEPSDRFNYLRTKMKGF